MYQLLFFDIDGTLCMPGDDPTPRTVHAIQSARERGCKCFLSTGRNITSIPKAVDAIGFDGYITNAGATALLGESLLLSVPIPDDVLRATLDAFYRTRCVFVLQTNKGNYCDYAQIDRIWNPRPTQIETYVDFTNRMLDVKDLSQLPPEEPVYKICFYTPYADAVRQLRQELSCWYSFTMFDNLFDDMELHSGEINQLAANKGKALRAFCDYFRVPTEETIAFGDSTNDLEMLQEAGLGVAMENAQQPLKAAADLIAPPCKEDGVAQIIEQYVLT